MRSRKAFAIFPITNKPSIKDEFLSEEDLSIAEMSDQELEEYWNYWLELAQTTNDEDKDSYSHGVFIKYPPHPQYK